VFLRLVAVFLAGRPGFRGLPTFFLVEVFLFIAIVKPPCFLVVWLLLIMIFQV